jgi:hypothetical protein
MLSPGYASVRSGLRGSGTHGRVRTARVGTVLLSVHSASSPLTCGFRMPMGGRQGLAGG